MLKEKASSLKKPNIGGEIAFLKFLFEIYPLPFRKRASLVAQLVKNLSAIKETRFDSWVKKIPWKRASTATHSSTVAWKIPTDRGAWWARVHGVTESDTTK